MEFQLLFLNACGLGFFFAKVGAIAPAYAKIAIGYLGSPIPAQTVDDPQQAKATGASIQRDPQKGN
jgi:hypothetical protein